MCAFVCGGKCCVESGDFLYFDARATSCYVHTPSAAHHQSLQPPSLATFFSRISSALSTFSRSLGFRARSGVGGIVGWRRKTSPSGKGERKPICGQVWISFPFYGKSSTMGGMIPSSCFPVKGGKHPEKINFHFQTLGQQS